jgi:hypothetical protein
MSVSGSDLASHAARWGSVFDRLYDPATYTGVYAERFRRCVAGSGGLAAGTVPRTANAAALTPRSLPPPACRPLRPSSPAAAPASTTMMA